MMLANSGLELQLLLDTSRHPHCYLCDDKIHKVSKIKHLPPEYRLCCICWEMIFQFAINRCTHKDISEFIDLTIDKVYSHQGKLKRRNFTEQEIVIIRLFKNFSLSEKDSIKDKFHVFFLNLNI